MTLRAVSGVGRLLEKDCSEQAEVALENIALNAQSETGRLEAVANLKFFAGRSTISLQEILPSEEEWFADVRIWDPEQDGAPEPGFPADHSFEPEPAPDL